MKLFKFLAAKKSESISPGEILGNYGVLLEKYPLAVLDTGMLPIPKAEMKKLLKSVWDGQQKNPELRNQIECSYIFLSHFQEGVGSTPILDPISNDGPPTDPEKFMEWMKINREKFQRRMEEWTKWHDKIQKEGQQLLGEIKSWK